MAPQTIIGPNEPLLRVREVTRTFGSTRALVDAAIDLAPGEICGLLGANGAGKSTLSRIISGHIAATSGTITLRGAPFTIRSTRDALKAGIALVAQETSLAPDMSVLENIFMPELATPGRLSFSAMRTRANAILGSLGRDHDVPLNAVVRTLSAAQRQLVEIAKALALESSLVIFDEPTASLSPMEVERLFDIMTRLRDNGRALVFVSHRLEEVLAITDNVTVLREGQTVARNVPTSSLTQSDIIRHMVGKDIGAIYQPRVQGSELAPRPVMLEVQNLKALPAVRDMSFSVRAGEILGLGGLVGAGRSEAMEAIFGLRPRDGGVIKVDGKVVNPRKASEAIAVGLGMVAEDRRAQSIVPDFTVRENLHLAHMGLHRGFGRGFATRSKQVADLIEKLGLPGDRLDASLLNYSGGMQQKVIIARWLLIEPRVLILDEPTKGVDIGTRASIYRILQDVADAGVAVIVISSDFEELLGICERVVVVSDGLTIANLPAHLLTEEKLTLLAAPRTSAHRNTELLRHLSTTYLGQAFWTLRDGDELICLALAAHPDAPETGLGAGKAIEAPQTRIPTAFGSHVPEFVKEPDSQRATLLKQILDKRGHDLGWIGLTVGTGGPLPPVKDIVEQVSRMLDQS